MTRICTGVATAAGTVLQAGVSYDLANEPKGEGPADYSGASSVFTCASALRQAEIPVTPKHHVQ